MGVYWDMVLESDTCKPVHPVGTLECHECGTECLVAVTTDGSTKAFHPDRGCRLELEGEQGALCS